MRVFVSIISYQSLWREFCVYSDTSQLHQKQEQSAKANQLDVFMKNAYCSFLITRIVARNKAVFIRVQMRKNVREKERERGRKREREREEER